ncbi:MAG: D-cysteine desulfhydrase family protein [Gemmatimonadetes bacterium]|nr:D-cysteine desulfhydrase family protein [Gemmatimonadota bacterium]
MSSRSRTPPHTGAQEAIERLRSVPRLALGFYPTPLEEAPRLRAALGPEAARLLIKRDDYTGFALGGNKVRKLEMLLAPERVRGVDTLITAGGVGSNHARVTAACAARLGMRCVLVLNGPPPEPPRGNALLHRWLGAEIVYVASRAERNPKMEEIADELRRAGGRPLIVPLGASTPLGSLGYALAALELERQLRALPEPPAQHEARGGGSLWILVPSSSCGTLAGILLGSRLCALRDARIVGVSADEPADEILERARTLAEEARRLIGWQEPICDAVLEASDAFVGKGYAIPTPESDAAFHRFARSEGILLDPVYTAKAAAALLAWVKTGRFAPHDTVVFWHTGGQPALFV